MDHEETIFEQALGISSPEERNGFLRRACADDEVMLERLEALLRAHERAGKFLEHDKRAGERVDASPPTGSEATATLAAQLTEKPGDRIGRYKLLQKIGEGGCGVVYMAEQEEPVRRRVALKIIKLGMDTHQVIGRFEAERQALALMDHPNIAKVHDGGATETGRPYFVMELVRGIKITDYCDEKKLTTHQRLELFMQVCRAVQHAHQKGIIHRDLKPSNILVSVNDGVAVSKVIDFGIAKATSGEPLTDKTVFTAFEQFIGTPAYMSPEQALVTSVDVDTRTDIYALGVLLYELLTGQTPFDSKELLQAGLDEMRRTIREKEPVRPSTRLSTLPGDALSTTAHRRGLDAPKLVSQLRGDLDWIVMKCLEKDRARRYETANGLAADIQRHLRNEPVLAFPPGKLYRIQKLIRRNKVAGAAAAGVMAALVIGLAVAMWQWVAKTRAYDRAVDSEQKAKTEAEKARQVAEFFKNMLQGVGPAVARGRDTTILREILEKTAKRLNKELTEQPEVEVELRNTLAGVYDDLGLYKQEEEMALQSVQLARSKLAPEHKGLADALNHYALALLRAGNLDRAESLARQGLDLRRRIFGREHADVADSLQILGGVLSEKSKFAEAESIDREGLAIRVRLFGKEHEDVATLLNNLSLVLLEQSKFPESEACAREALVIYRKKLGEDHPFVAAALNDLGLVLNYQGKYEEAETLYRQSLALEITLHGTNHPAYFRGLFNLAHVLDAANKFAEAETLQRQALNLVPSMSGRDDGPLAASLDGLGYMLQRRGKLEEAEALFRDALEIRSRLGSRPNRPDHTFLFNLAWLRAAQGKGAEAETLHRQALEMRRSLLGNDHLQVAKSLEHLGGLLCERGQFAEGEPMLREVLAIKCKLLGRENPHVAIALNDLGLMMRQKGDVNEAEAMFREALAINEKTVTHEHSEVSATLNNLALVLREQGKLQEAEPVFREALALNQRLLGKENPDAILRLNNLALLLTDLAQLEEAETLFREAQAMARKLYGEEHPDVAWSLDNLSGLLRNQGKLAEAEETRRKALVMRRKLLGDKHPDVAVSLNGLAATVRAQGRLAEAETLYREGLAMRKDIFGNEHPSTASSLNNLAGVLQDEGKLAEAETCYREVLAIRKKRLPDEHPDIAATLASLGFVLCLQEKPGDAEPLLRQSLEIRQKKQPGDWRTFNTVSLLGGSLLGQKNYIAAQPLLLSGYQGMNERIGKIPAEGKVRVKEALQRLVQLYEANGPAAQADEWKNKLAEFDQVHVQADGR